MMVIALRLRHSRNRVLERRGAGVEARFVLVDEDEVERVDQIGEAAIVGQRLVPAEVPRRGDASLAQLRHDRRPLAAVVRIEAEMKCALRLRPRFGEQISPSRCFQLRIHTVVR